MKVIHLAECEPEQHPDWAATVYRDAIQGGALCPATTYMKDELYADEQVWVETAENAPTLPFRYLIGYVVPPRSGTSGMYFTIGSHDVARSNQIRTNEDVLNVQEFLRGQLNNPDLAVFSFSPYAATIQQ